MNCESTKCLFSSWLLVNLAEHDFKKLLTFSTPSTTLRSTRSTRWTPPPSRRRSWRTRRKRCSRWRRRRRSWLRRRRRRHRRRSRKPTTRAAATSTKTSERKSTPATKTTFDSSGARRRAWWCHPSPTRSTTTPTSTRDSWARPRRSQRRCCGLRSLRLKTRPHRRRHDTQIEDDLRQPRARVRTRRASRSKRPVTTRRNITGSSEARCVQVQTRFPLGKIQICKNWCATGLRRFVGQSSSLRFFNDSGSCSFLVEFFPSNEWKLFYSFTASLKRQKTKTSLFLRFILFHFHRKFISSTTVFSLLLLLPLLFSLGLFTKKGERKKFSSRKRRKSL